MTALRVSQLNFVTSCILLCATHLPCACSHAYSCQDDPSSADASLSLLQIGSKHTRAQSTVQSHQHPAAGVALDALPPHLYHLGLKLLGKEEFLDAFVNSTQIVRSPADNIIFRMSKNDGFDEMAGYGLDSLTQLGVDSKGMLNMIDIGANLGRVSCAAFKKNPEKIRIVAVEPVPTTYLLLRWNLWLNNIPELTEKDIKKNHTKAGVLALHNAVASKDGETLGMCYTFPFTMLARVCDCEVQEKLSELKYGNRQCLPVASRGIGKILDLFDAEPIALLKMDCEGCEQHAMLAMDKHLRITGQRIERLAGELHEQPNEVESVACKYEEGKWFEHVCFVQNESVAIVVGGVDKGYFTKFNLKTRCEQGPTRTPCFRQSLAANKTAILIGDWQ